MVLFLHFVSCPVDVLMYGLLGRYPRFGWNCCLRFRGR